MLNVNLCLVGTVLRDEDVLKITRTVAAARRTAIKSSKLLRTCAVPQHVG